MARRKPLLAIMTQKQLGSVQVGVLVSVVSFCILIVAIIYHNGARQKGTGKPWLRRRGWRQRRRAKFDYGYDPIMLDQVANGDVEHKFNVVNYLEAATERRLRRLLKVYGQELSDLENLENEVKDLEFGLQKTRREIAKGGGDQETLRRLIDTRGSEIFGPEWNTSVNGAPTLSHVIAPDEKAEEWRVPNDKFGQRLSARRSVHPVPRLALDKL